jgi:hypothetical protein
VTTRGHSTCLLPPTRCKNTLAPFSGKNFSRANKYSSLLAGTVSNISVSLTAPLLPDIVLRAEMSRFRLPIRSLNSFLIYLILPASLGLRIYSVSNKNGNQKQTIYFCDVESSRSVRLTPLSPYLSPF